MTRARRNKLWPPAPFGVSADKLQASLAALADALTELRDVHQRTLDAANALEVLPRRDGVPSWRKVDGVPKYLYLDHRTKDGNRRVYIGSDPAVTKDVLQAVQRQREYLALRFHLDVLDARLELADKYLNRALAVLTGNPRSAR